MANTYVIQPGDLALTLHVEVTATNAVGSATVSSAGSAVITNPPLTATNNIVALLGDSRPFRVDGDAQPTAGFMHHAGFALWARRYSGGAIQFNRAHNFAVGGYTTQNVVDSKLSACAASDAGSVIVMVGVNDALGAGANPPVVQATSLANIDTIANTLVAAGKTVFFCDDSPATEPGGAIAQHVAIRDHIRAITTAGVYVVPTWNAAALTPDSTTPGTGFEDTVHYGPAAASRVGQAVATVAQPRLPTFDLFGRSGVLSGGDFTGTTGTLLGGVTGTAPTGWTVALESGTGTVSSALSVSGGLNWLVVTLASGATPKIAIYTSGSLASGWSAGTDRLDMAIKCKIDAGSANIIQCQLDSRRENATELLLSNGNKAYDGAIIGSTPDTLTSSAMDMTFWLPHVLFPAGATSFNQRLEIRGLAATTSSGVFRFALPQLRKYTGTLTD